MFLGQYSFQYSSVEEFFCREVTILYSGSLPWLGLSGSVRNSSWFREEIVLIFLYNIDQVFVVGTKIPMFGLIDTNIDIWVLSCQ
jgi:hypothetical protein